MLVLMRSLSAFVFIFLLLTLAFVEKCVGEDDLENVKNNLLLSPLTRHFLEEHSGKLIDKEVRSFLGLDKVAINGQNQQHTGGDVVVECVISLLLQERQLYFIERNDEWLDAESPRWLAVLSDGRTPVSWITLSRVSYLNGFKRPKLLDERSEVFILQCTDNDLNFEIELIVDREGNMKTHYPAHLLKDVVDRSGGFESPCSQN